jgi:hypothetical protein
MIQSGRICRYLGIRVPLVGTKPKDLYPGPPRIGSRVQCKNRTPIDYKLYQGGQRQATHLVPGRSDLGFGLVM